VQRIAHVQPDPFLCFNWAQTHLPSIPSFRKNRCPPSLGAVHVRRSQGRTKFSYHPGRHSHPFSDPTWILKDLEQFVFLFALYDLTHIKLRASPLPRNFHYGAGGKRMNPLSGFTRFPAYCLVPTAYFPFTNTLTLIRNSGTYSRRRYAP
jgi:hypothetical protein